MNEPTIKTTDDILDDNIRLRLLLRKGDITEKDIIEFQRSKWLLVSEEIAWLEKEIGYYDKQRNVPLFRNDIARNRQLAEINVYREITSRLLERLAQLKGARE